MAKTRVYISFDFDHDEDCKNLLVGQAKSAGSPFEIADWSLTEAVKGDWKSKARRRIRAVDVGAALCGKHTDSATGVAAEVTIAQEEKIPYFLLAARADGGSKKPSATESSDMIYKWTWDNLKKLIEGER